MSDFPIEPTDHLYAARRLPSQMPFRAPDPKGRCLDCRDTGVMTVTLWGVRDSASGRYEQEDQPCRCPLGALAQPEGVN